MTEEKDQKPTVTVAFEPDDHKKLRISAATWGHSMAEYVRLATLAKLQAEAEARKKKEASNDDRAATS